MAQKNNVHRLINALDLPATTISHPDGKVEVFVHTDPKSLDPALSPLERGLHQALEYVEYEARKRRGGGGGIRTKPKKPVLTG